MKSKDRLAYDAVLMDIMMPVLDGISATREIRASSHPDAAVIPIIAMTANAYAADVKNCLDAGMNAHVSKPVNPKLLLSVLAEQITARGKLPDKADKK